jgi:hypothetical protein
MGFQGPFPRLCLCLAKLRFPAAETGVGGTLGNNFWEYQSRCGGGAVMLTNWLEPISKLLAAVDPI